MNLLDLGTLTVDSRTHASMATKSVAPVLENALHQMSVDVVWTLGQSTATSHTLNAKICARRSNQANSVFVIFLSRTAIMETNVLCLTYQDPWLAIVTLEHGLVTHSMNVLIAGALHLPLPLLRRI